jgi:hypothetical protein
MGRRKSDAHSRIRPQIISEIARHATPCRGLSARQSIITAVNASNPARSTTPINATSKLSSATQNHFVRPLGSDIQNASTPERCTITSPSLT